ncbi:hypothetical protein JCM8097_005515 [Rhodosporidiobolus ruineniae]
MLKAKMKAAATAAAAKKKAAAAAAAQQEQAAQQAAAAASGMGVSTTRSGRGIRPNVTQYWADSSAQLLAPGGSIQRIGYDQAAFEEAIRVVVFGNEPSPEASTSKVGLIEPKEGKEKKEGGEKGKEGEEEKEGGEGYKTNKEDLAVVTAALDLPAALASSALRSHKGDLEATLRDLSAPQAVLAA